MSNTLILRPKSHTVSSSSTYSSYSVLEKAYDSNLQTYAITTAKTSTSTIQSGHGITGSVIVYYDFDISAIPAGSKIVSATLYAKCYYSLVAGRASGGKVTQSSTRTFGLYNDRTFISSSTISISQTSATTSSLAFTDAQIESWFTSSNPSVRLYNYTLMRNSSSTASATVTIAREQSIYLYELYVEVEYENAGVTARNKIQNNWRQNVVDARVGNEIKTPTKGFTKVDGLWRPIS